jgi:hypothetical protein
MRDTDKLFKLDLKEFKTSHKKSQNGTKGREKLQKEGKDFGKDVVKKK